MKDISLKFANINRPVVDISKIKKINYNSKSFLKGLYKIRKEIEKSDEMQKPDYTKKRLAYDI